MAKKPAAKNAPPWEARVEVTPIAKGLVRLDVFDADHDSRACAVLTKEQAKALAVALAKA